MVCTVSLRALLPGPGWVLHLSFVDQHRLYCTLDPFFSTQVRTKNIDVGSGNRGELGLPERPLAPNLTVQTVEYTCPRNVDIS